MQSVQKLMTWLARMSLQPATVSTTKPPEMRRGKKIVVNALQPNILHVLLPLPSPTAIALPPTTLHVSYNEKKNS